MTDELNAQIGRNALDDLETAAKYVEKEHGDDYDAEIIRECVERLRPFVDAVANTQREWNQ